MIKMQQVFPGDFIADTYAVGYNRTGSTLKVGQLVMCDLATSQAESLDGSTAEGANPMGNWILPTTAGSAAGYPIGVVQNAAADNGVLRVLLTGRTRVACVDDDVGNDDVDVGSSISPVDAAGYASLWTTGRRRIGIALHAGAASTADPTPADGDLNAVSLTEVDASSHLVDCIFWGGLPGVGVPTA